MSFADSRLIRSMVSNCGNLAHEVTPQMNSASIGASKVASGEFGPAQPYDGQEGVMPKIAPRSENFMYLMYLVSMAITLPAVFLIARVCEKKYRRKGDGHGNEVYKLHEVFGPWSNLSHDTLLQIKG